MDNFDLRKYLAEQKSVTELEKGSAEFDLAKNIKLMHDIAVEHIKSPQAALTFVDTYRAVMKKLQAVEDGKREFGIEPTPWNVKAVAEE